MKKKSSIVFSILFMAAISLGLGACASKEKAAEGPEAKQAAEAKPKPAEGTVEVQPSPEDLKRQQDEEAERQRKAELDKMKEEAAQPPAAVPVAGAAAVAATAGGAFTPEQLEKTYFDFDKYEIKQEFREALQRNAAAIKGNPAVKVVVEGHCDERGTEDYNLALGERRAIAVKNFLMTLGVTEGQLYTISYGEERPAAEGHAEPVWSQNRRVQFSQE